MREITEFQFFKQLTQLPFVLEISLYGSRARNDHRSTSDIDLSITCPNATDADWLKVLDIIDEADTLLKIDLVRFDTLEENEPIKSEILRDRKILFKREANAAAP